VLTEEEYNERVEDYFETENMRDFWQQAVSSGNTTLGLEDWVELVRDTDGDSIVIERATDEQAEQLKKLLGDEAVFETDVRGGGRCFDKGMKWDKLFNVKLWDIIKSFED